MNSLKSTCVVLVLAGVLYGVYVTLNAPVPAPQSPSNPLTEVQPPSIDFGPASQPPSLPTAGTTSNLPILTTEPVISPPASSQSLVSPANTAPPSANVVATFSAPDSATSSAAPAFEPVVEQPAAAVASTLTSPNPSATATLPTTTESSPALEAHKLKRAWQAVELHVKDGKLRDALAELSPFAGNAHLASEDRAAVYQWLDALAAKVIYGPEHYLSEPFRVTNRKQTLYEVAAANKVPIQLLQNINSQTVKDPSVLLPGTELKVIPGPFRAELSLAAGELTLFVGPLYAGRFAFTVGDERPAAGTYHVQQKDSGRTYIGRDGRQIAAGDPANPYGNCWIDLGRNASMHGSPTSATQGPSLGCLSFSPQDAVDLYGILSPQSEVIIKP